MAHRPQSVLNTEKVLLLRRHTQSHQIFTFPSLPLAVGLMDGYLDNCITCKSFKRPSYFFFVLTSPTPNITGKLEANDGQSLCGTPRGDLVWHYQALSWVLQNPKCLAFHLTTTTWKRKREAFWKCCPPWRFPSSNPFTPQTHSRIVGKCYHSNTREKTSAWGRGQGRCLSCGLPHNHLGLLGAWILLQILSSSSLVPHLSAFPFLVSVISPPSSPAPILSSASSNPLPDLLRILLLPAAPPFLANSSMHLFWSSLLSPSNGDPPPVFSIHHWFESSRLWNMHHWLHYYYFFFANQIKNSGAPFAAPRPYFEHLYP